MRYVTVYVSKSKLIFVLYFGLWGTLTQVWTTWAKFTHACYLSIMHVNPAFMQPFSFIKYVWFERKDCTRRETQLNPPAHGELSAELSGTKNFRSANSSLVRQALNCSCNKVIYLYVKSAQSHQPEVAIPNSYDKCEPGLIAPSCAQSIFCSNTYVPFQ